MKEKLFEYWQGCSANGECSPDDLKIVYIKPLSYCLTGEEDDFFNMLLLCPTYYELFESKVISFDVLGELIFSMQLSSVEIELLHIPINCKLSHNKLRLDHTTYLCERNELFFNKITKVN